MSETSSTVLAAFVLLGAVVIVIVLGIWQPHAKIPDKLRAKRWNETTKVLASITGSSGVALIAATFVSPVFAQREVTPPWYWPWIGGGLILLAVTIVNQMISEE